MRTAIATRRGIREHNCDAAVVRPSADLTAAALVDGIGNSSEIAATAQLLAEVTARISAVRGGLAALLTAGMLLADGDPDAVAVTAVTGPVHTDVAWVGDARAYGWNGHRLKQYTTDHTVGQQLRINGAPAELAEDHDNWVRTTVGDATVGTVYTAKIPDPTVLLTSDGVHDSVPHNELEALLREHTAPQTLADAIVAAVRADSDGYRDDATVVVLSVL